MRSHTKFAASSRNPSRVRPRKIFSGVGSGSSVSLWPIHNFFTQFWIKKVWENPFYRPFFFLGIGQFQKSADFRTSKFKSANKLKIFWISTKNAPKKSAEKFWILTFWGQKKKSTDFWIFCKNKDETKKKSHAWVGKLFLTPVGRGFTDLDTLGHPIQPHWKWSKKVAGVSQNPKKIS